MSRIHPKHHNWNWLHATAKYEYQQCQHPSCNKIRSIDKRSGDIKVLTLAEVKRLWGRL